MKQLLAPVTLLLAAATACGGSAAGSPATTGSPSSGTTGARGNHVVITGTDDFRFIPEQVSVHTGTVTFELRDNGAYPHNLAFPALHRTSDTVTGDLGKTSTTFTVTFNHPGTYRFVCTYHSQAGMVGELRVT
ncbi:MAG TPA: plastocyanin/azurin family copper-binding protein [Mycobacteriales bacterium]|nr:plastocyanin/azurin family copper-binding protein [Mycobacteriales bacterium]